MCTVTCGRGTRTRTRICVTTVPMPDCTGSDFETEICSLRVSHVIVFDVNLFFIDAFDHQDTCPSWSSFPDIPEGFVEACSESCDGGLLRQRRQCRGGFPGEIGCSGSRVRLVPCNEQVNTSRKT